MNHEHRTGPESSNPAWGILVVVGWGRIVVVDQWVKLLEQGLASMRPFVIGELACGTLRNREEVLDLTSGLPTVVKADDEEVLHFTSTCKLNGRGFGLTDVYLLAVCYLNDCKPWTRDRRLLAAAEALKVATQSIASFSHCVLAPLPPLAVDPRS